jgi:hypothetical protein
MILPHDPAHGDKVFATSYESGIREAQFDVLVIPNQGAGAAMARIETAGCGTFPDLLQRGNHGRRRRRDRLVSRKEVER